MAGSININDYWVNQNQIPTLADVEDGIEQATLVGIDDTNMASGAGVITIGTASPAASNGKAWIDTNSLAGAPEVRPRIYNSVSTEWLGWNIIYSLTQPATTTTGWLWYDMTCKLLRVYRAATYDPHGLLGWHPVSEQYQLWQNKSGGYINPYRVVVQYTAAAVERAFTTSTIGKDATVVGVTLATIATDAHGLIATVAGGAVVDIYCNVTSGNIALGDGICNSAVAGEGRTAGELAANPAATAGTMQYGMPHGCFAVSQQALTTATITACRLLGFVGTGRDSYFGEDACANATTGFTTALFNGAWNEINLASMPLAGDAVVDNGSAKHKPIVGVFATVEIAGSSAPQAAGGNIAVEFSKNASVVNSRVRFGATVDQQANVSFSGAQGGLFIPTSGGAAASYITLGEYLQWKGTMTGFAAVATNTKLWITGYRY
jgi:hypothetical protein